MGQEPRRQGHRHRRGAEKAKLAKRHGCSHVIDYNKGDFVKRVREITKGKGVPVVYDSVGKQTFLKSLDCLAPLGTMVLFGQSSGPPDALNVGTLAAKGSLFLTRPGLANYTATRDDLEACARDLFAPCDRARSRLRSARGCHSRTPPRPTGRSNRARPRAQRC